MEAKSQRSKERNVTISALNAAIEALNSTENISSVTPAKTVFDSVTALLTTIKESMVDEPDYVELGLSCADVCRAFDRGLHGKKSDEISRPVYDAIGLLTSTVADIQKKLIKWGQRNVVSQHLHAKRDKEKIATWKLELDKILRAFSKELIMNTSAAGSTVYHSVTNAHNIVSDVPGNTSKSPEDVGGQDRITYTSTPEESQPPPPTSTDAASPNIRHDVVETAPIVSEADSNCTSAHPMVSDPHRTILKGQEGSNGNNPLMSETWTVPPKHVFTVAQTQTRTLDESPPPPPQVCFGRSELIEKAIDLAENLTSIALVGPGGIGKTSIALTVLHHDRIKQRFGPNRHFIRCDQFPASCIHLLNRLSKVIGAGVENPKDLGSLRPFLSSREILVVLDNAETVLDPGGTDAGEIYAVVEELSQIDSLCLCITSRIFTIPPDCKTVEVPTLLINAARQAFYHICKNDERPDLVDDILDQLDFHPLSITLLATVAQRNKWGMGRLTTEWGRQRTGMLHMKYTTSLAATIELSLASPMFQQLGPDARALLGVVAFFPQGVDENNFEWLFPTVSNVTDIFDTFCVLSLTDRGDPFITMLAPLRDHLRPKDPKLSPFLCTAKERYFTRMSVDISLEMPEHGEARWIVLEDVNVEHLLDVFTSIDADSCSVWYACAYFIRHIFYHKRRLTILGPKIEGLPDDHPSKLGCVVMLSYLLHSIGNYAESKRILTSAIKFEWERGNECGVAGMLGKLAEMNRDMGLNEEAERLAKESLEFFERVGDTAGQAKSLLQLATALCSDNQYDAAEEAISRAINLLPENGQKFLVCQAHRALGSICTAKRELKRAVRHFGVALGIASSFNWHDELFWVHIQMVRVSVNKHRLDDAHAHLEQAKSHTVNNTYYLAHATRMQAQLLWAQRRFEEAKSEALRAADVFEKFGALKDLKECGELLGKIEEGMSRSGIPEESGDDERDMESK